MKLHPEQVARGEAKCRQCDAIKPLEDFRQWRTRKNPGRAISKHCLLCEAVDSVPKLKKLGIIRRPGLTKKQAFILRKKSKPCMDCGQMFPAVCMDFDHRPGTRKLFQIGSGAADRTMDSIKAEIKKCDLVCACCHRLRTHRRGYVGNGRPKKLKLECVAAA